MPQLRKVRRLPISPKNIFDISRSMATFHSPVVVDLLGRFLGFSHSGPVGTAFAMVPAYQRQQAICGVQQ